MLKKGKLIKLTYNDNGSIINTSCVYVGEGIIDDKVLFLKVSRLVETFTMFTLPSTEVLNMEEISNAYLTGLVADADLVDDSLHEKFRYWYMNRDKCPSELNTLCLSSPALIDAFKLFNFEQFKEYFMKDYVLTLFLSQILKNNCDAIYLDKFKGYDLTIYNCLKGLAPKTNEELYAFIVFINLNLNGYKRDTGLTEDDCKYFNQLERAILQGINYTNYPRNELDPDIREIMWFYACSDVLALYIKLLNSRLHKNDIYKLFNNHYVSLIALDCDHLDAILDNADNFEDIYKLLYLISYREMLSEPKPSPYVGEFDAYILYTGFDNFRLKNKRRDKLIDF